MNVAWAVLHCNRRIGARERRQLIPHVRFQVPFLGPESQLKSGFACAGLPCTPGGSHDEGGLLVRNLLAEFLRGFSLRTLIFLLDMVLPQLDAYHAGRQLQHLQPWVSVELAQQKKRGQTGNTVTGYLPI